MAVADLSKAIELDPKDAKAWYNQGVVYAKQGQMDKAVTDFSRAIELGPKSVLAWYNRGNAYNELGQLDKAVADFSQAIDLDPKYAPAWNNRGNAYNELGQPAKAIADYSRAIELDPKYVLAWYNRGVAYAKLGQPGQAVADFSKVIELVPAHAGAHNALAWLLATYPDAKLRDPDRAVELAKRAIQLKPKAGIYWKTLGVAHYRAGDGKAALAAFNKSAELRKGRDAVERLFLAMAYQKLGKHDEARKEYERAVQWLEKNKEVLEKDKTRAEELRRFRAEAEEVLELKKK
jgi:tetratricopeptide (TPR) repeat protein